MVSRVHWAAAAALDEKSRDVDLAGHDQVVVAGQAEVAALARELDAAVRARRRSRPGRRGTRSPRPRRRRRRQARPRRRAGCRARPRAARCASGCLLQCPGNGSQGYRWAIGALAVAAGDRRGGGRRRGGNAPAPAAQRHHRAGRRGREIVLHGDPARPRGGLPQPPAPDDRRGGLVLEHGHAGAAGLAAAAACCSSGSRAGRSSGRRSPGRASRCCWWWSTCRCRPGATSARSTSGCRPRNGPTGSATWASRRVIGAGVRGGWAARWRWRSCGASRATGGRRRRSW